MPPTLAESVEGILGPHGRIQRRDAKYEHRQEQMQMAMSVVDALVRRQHLIVEAGTGVGKSFAYLVPAILAVAGEARQLKRIVISTHTINLQEQLLQKDIPLLRSVMPCEFTAVLAKGRRNFVSLRRLQNAVKRAPALFHRADDVDQVYSLLDWAGRTKDGTLSDLPARPAPAVWDEVHSDHGNCMGRQCPTNNECFYYQARRRTHNADIIVVNHALFFTDLSLRRQDAKILPDYDAVIFDEAHMLEGVASEHLGWTLSQRQLDFQLRKLFNDRSQRGLLAAVNSGSVRDHTTRCRGIAADFFARIESALPSRAEASHRLRASCGVTDILGPPLKKLAEMVQDAGETTFPESEQSQDFLAAADRIRTTATAVGGWLAQDCPEDVFWVEQTPQPDSMTLCRAPLDIGPILRQELFDKVAPIILASATLKAGKDADFKFFQSQVGVLQCNTLAVGSPFDYQTQMQLYLYRGIPDPASERVAFESAVLSLLPELISCTKGHAMVLFTSYDLLKRAALFLAPWLKTQQLALYQQAEGVSAAALVRQFKENPQGVLLGTDSLWQGVDLPGTTLQNVIIPKLPFGVPNRPLPEARQEAIRSQGGNPFLDYSLPECALKLKQGFGRLVRTRQDRGQVAILDPRVLTKPYGKSLLAALPDCKKVIVDYVAK